MVATELTNKANRSGVRKTLSGTPGKDVKYSEWVESTFTHCVLFLIYEWNQENRGLPMPKESRVEIRWLCST